jgi:energy-coupling factor transport system permease protein
MLNNIKIGRYYNTRSKIHDMNPLAKILSIFIFVILSLIVNDLMINLTISVIVLLVLGLTHVPFKTYFKTIYGIRILLLFILIINLILKVEIETTLLIITRLLSLVLYTSILTLTTPPSEIAFGLEQFLSPLKILRIPVNKMALSISLALRFIPTLIDQANRILKAEASRGIDYSNSNIKGKLEAFKALIIPLFILSFKRADDLADSMEVRLYDLNKKRTNYRTNSFKFFDFYIVLMHLAFLTLIIVRGVLK